MTFAAIKFRDDLLMNAPRWLRATNGYRLLFAIGTQIDAMADAAFWALKARYPGIVDPLHTLPPLGKDRRIRRGPAESSATYAQRLRNWREVNRRRGLGYLMLTEMQKVMAPYACDCWIVHNRGTSATPAEDGRALKMSSAGVFTEYDQAWYWDDSEDLTRFWVVITIPDGLLELDTYWGDAGDWGDGGYWAVEGDASDYIRNLYSLISDMTPAHARLESLIVLPETEATNFWANPPDGDWDQWGNRNPAVLYV